MPLVGLMELDLIMINLGAKFKTTLPKPVESQPYIKAYSTRSSSSSHAHHSCSNLATSPSVQCHGTLPKVSFMSTNSKMPSASPSIAPSSLLTHASIGSTYLSSTAAFIPSGVWPGCPD